MRAYRRRLTSKPMAPSDASIAEAGSGVKHDDEQANNRRRAKIDSAPVDDNRL